MTASFFEKLKNLTLFKTFQPFLGLFLSDFITLTPLMSRGGTPCGFSDWLSLYRAKIILQKAVWNPKWSKISQNSMIQHSDSSAFLKG
jgi:hypothetical protein